ncbi:MAG: hypothetical protein D6678_01160 [Zetaproteobacteria bacterium]|nr:MAG: hypothetical protein D6678_01160 [Zetaproteobacteria bacterium]
MTANRVNELFWLVMAVAMLGLVWRALGNLYHALRENNWHALLWSLIACIIALLTSGVFLMLAFPN